MTHPPADRFRLGDTWRSPAGKDWYVERIAPGYSRGVLLVRKVNNRRTTQWRGDFSTGTNMMNAWQRIDPPTEP